MLFLFFFFKLFDIFQICTDVHIAIIFFINHYNKQNSRYNEITFFTY